MKLSSSSNNFQSIILGTQYDTNFSAPQFSEGQHGRVQDGRLLRSCEVCLRTKIYAFFCLIIVRKEASKILNFLVSIYLQAPNHPSNHMIGPVEDPAHNFSFKVLNCPTILQTSNYHHNLRMLWVTTKLIRRSNSKILIFIRYIV